MADDEKSKTPSPEETGWPGEKDGEFNLEAKGEDKAEVKGAKKETPFGNRKPEPAKPGDPPKPPAEKNAVEKSKEVGFGPVYKKTFFDDQVYTSKEGDDDKSFATSLSGKLSAEVLSGAYNLDEKKAKLTLVKATAEGTVAHGQFDLAGWVGDLIFGEEPKPQKPPATPPAPMAARVGDITVHGSPLVPGPGSPNVLIGGKPAWRAASDVHLCPFPGSAHGSGPTAAGAASVLINGFPAARAGDYVVEPTGGPDVILLGCLSVLIGPKAKPPPPPGKPPEKKPEELPWVQFESVVSGDVAQGQLEANVGAEFDGQSGKIVVEAQAGAVVAALKGELPLKVRIRIPYTTYYVGLGVKVEGTLLSAGAEGGAGVKFDPYAMKPFEMTAGAKVGAGLGGVGAKFGLDVSK